MVETVENTGSKSRVSENLSRSGQRMRDCRGGHDWDMFQHRKSPQGAHLMSTATAQVKPEGMCGRDGRGHTLTPVEAIGNVDV